jgi:hypothetical protein
MLVLLHLDPTDARAQKAYRLQVKERLYRFNFVSSFVRIVALNLCLHIVRHTGDNDAAGERGTIGEIRGNIPERKRRLPADIGYG